jgi:tRNA(adenine34) deaminase
MAHDFFMNRCIELALLARDRGDSPVGSLLTKNNQIIAEGIEGGRTHRDITYHAEIEAIREAVRKLGNPDLSDCLMYTTVEPCIMCSYVIRHHRVNMVVIGLTTGEAGGLSSAYKILEDRTVAKWGEPPIIITGILESECKSLLI